MKTEGFFTHSKTTLAPNWDDPYPTALARVTSNQVYQRHKQGHKNTQRGEITIFKRQNKASISSIYKQWAYPIFFDFLGMRIFLSIFYCFEAKQCPLRSIEAHYTPKLPGDKESILSLKPYSASHSVLRSIRVFLLARTSNRVPEDIVLTRSGDEKERAKQRCSVKATN